MSALGHKQTFAPHKGMSALPPKADIGAAQINVRFVPIADIPLLRRHHARRLGPRSSISVANEVLAVPS
jgi:hypothetical protein